MMGADTLIEKLARIANASSCIVSVSDIQTSESDALVWLEEEQQRFETRLDDVAKSLDKDNFIYQVDVTQGEKK